MPDTTVNDNPQVADVTGPVSSLDNAVARFNGTDGKTVQNSGVTIDDSDNLALPAAAKLDVDEIECNANFNLDVKKVSTITTVTIANSANTPNGCDLTVDGGIEAKDGVTVSGGSLAVSAGSITLSGTVDTRDVATDGTKLDAIESAADVTDAANVNTAGAVMETDYNANTVLAATSDDTPVTLTVAEDTVVGRITGGNIAAIKGPSVAEVLFGDSFNTWVSNQWYTQSPLFNVSMSSTGEALATDTVEYFPLFITHRVTFDTFGFQVATAESGKNARIAIYNSSAGAPTSVVVESGNMSLASTGIVTVAITETTIQAGAYFWAVNADSSTAATRRFSGSINTVVASLGAASAGVNPHCRYLESSAFGAFPDPATPGSSSVTSWLPLLKLQVV